MIDQPTDWQPLIEIPTNVIHPATPEAVAEIARHYDITVEKALRWIKSVQADVRCFVNDLYNVEVGPAGTGGLRVTVQRLDGELFKDWRHFQQIKNEVAGEEREAVELYPAESRKVDTSNKWHLWVLPEGVKFDLGFPERDVRYDGDLDIPGIQQRGL
jgi:hypothetical protein